MYINNDEYFQYNRVDSPLGFKFDYTYNPNNFYPYDFDDEYGDGGVVMILDAIQGTKVDIVNTDSLYRTLSDKNNLKLWNRLTNNLPLVLVMIEPSESERLWAHTTLTSHYNFSYERSPSDYSTPPDDIGWSK